MWDKLQRLFGGNGQGAKMPEDPVLFNIAYAKEQYKVPLDLSPASIKKIDDVLGTGGELPDDPRHAMIGTLGQIHGEIYVHTHGWGSEEGRGSASLEPITSAATRLHGGMEECLQLQYYSTITNPGAPLPDWMAFQAELFIEYAKDRYGVLVDYRPISIDALDGMAKRIKKEPSGMRDFLIAGMGALIGEIAIRDKGLKWVGHEWGPAIDKNGALNFVTGWAVKRVLDGEADMLRTKYDFLIVSDEPLG
jgi:hypothetical protein